LVEYAGLKFASFPLSWTGWNSQPGCARRQLAAEFGASQALTVRCCLSLAGW